MSLFDDSKLQRWAKSIGVKAAFKFPEYLISRREAEQESLLALWHASKRTKDCSIEQFRAFAAIRIKGSIRDLTRSRSTYRRREWQKIKIEQNGAEPPVRFVDIEEVAGIIADEGKTPDQEFEEQSDLLELRLRFFQESHNLLNKQQRHMLTEAMRGKTNRQIAEECGVSESRVSQVIKYSIQVLRKERRSMKKTRGAMME